jgi:4,5-DOPA dioxygenase extradiol
MSTGDHPITPVLFIGHGNPMNALGENEYARGWRSFVQDIAVPRAVLCISAHWETRGSVVNTSPRPGTVHDFYGFPEALFRMQYPCPGSPETASDVRRLVRMTGVGADPDRGLDHGAWAVLCHMYPEASVPVFQLSLDATKPPRFHYELGRELRPLRKKGILVVGSGNLVHNLAVADMRYEDAAYDWAERFDQRAEELILAGEDDTLVDCHTLGRDAKRSIPTNEHYLPLLYVLGLRDSMDEVVFFNDKVVYGSVGMRSVRFG